MIITDLDNDTLYNIFQKLDKYSLLKTCFSCKYLNFLIEIYFGKDYLNLLYKDIILEKKTLQLNHKYIHKIITGDLCHGKCEQCSKIGFIKKTKTFCFSSSSYEIKKICIEECHFKCPVCNQIKIYNNINPFSYPSKLRSYTDLCFHCYQFVNSRVFTGAWELL